MPWCIGLHLRWAARFWVVQVSASLTDVNLAEIIVRIWHSADIMQVCR